MCMGALRASLCTVVDCTATTQNCPPDLYGSLGAHINLIGHNSHDHSSLPNTHSLFLEVDSGSSWLCKSHIGDSLCSKGLPRDLRGRLFIHAWSDHSWSKLHEEESVTAIVCLRFRIMMRGWVGSRSSTLAYCGANQVDGCRFSYLSKVLIQPDSILLVNWVASYSHEMVFQ